MAAYRRVYGFGHLRADCRGPGSAPEPYARFEYGTTFAFTPGHERFSTGPPRKNVWGFQMRDFLQVVMPLLSPINTLKALDELHATSSVAQNEHSSKLINSEWQRDRQTDRRASRRRNNNTLITFTNYYVLEFVVRTVNYNKQKSLWSYVTKDPPLEMSLPLQLRVKIAL